MSRRRPRATLAAAAAVTLLCISPHSARAVTDTQTGTPGSPGPNGTVFNNGGVITVTPGSPGTAVSITHATFKSAAAKVDEMVAA